VVSHLIIIVALFLSMLFIIHYYICKEPVTRKSLLKPRLILGVSFGCVSVALMVFRYQLDSAVFDLRHLPVLMAAFYGGWASAIPAAIVASIGRFFMYEQTGNFFVSVFILGLDVLIGVALPQMIRSYRLSWIITLVTDLIMLYVVLPFVLNIHRFDFWAVYSAAALIGGAIAFQLTESLRNSQQMLLELKKSQEDLEKTVHHLYETKEQLESYVFHNTDGIVIFDSEERIRKVNPAFEKMSGWTEEELIGSGTLPWIPEEILDEVSQFFRQKRLTGPVINYKTERMRKNGDIFHVSVSVFTIYDQRGQIIGFSAVYRDITEQKRTEEILQNREKLSLVGELAAGIAHEIRNPLTTLKGFTQFIKKDNPSPYLDIMSDELDRIEEITNEFLFLAKPLAAETKTVSINELLEQVMVLLTSQATLHGIELLIEKENTLPVITCNASQIKQVFINLLKNAIDALPNGGEVRLVIQADEKEVIISVIDNGMGIPEDRIEKLGQPFYSLKEKGTGLGLMICKKIIHEHKGSLSFESEVGKGTTVQVRLPYNIRTV